MSERFDKFTKALDRLIRDGDMLHMAMQYDCYGEDFVEHVREEVGEHGIEKYLKELPSFDNKYQAWYSEAQALIKKILPYRFTDFQSYYEYPRIRKEISFQNYMIKDYLQGLQITRIGDIIVDRSAAIPEFRQQLSIVRAAKEKLDSALIDLTAILQADLFDSEIESARALAKAGYLRAAGAICGVVIEKHLLQVSDAHAITIRKKNPAISDLNQALKDKDAITVPQWRFIQHLADIRNLCGHAKTKEPTKDEIDDLLSGTEKVLKTVF
ncbi:hypothetical protein [Algihabitans albus]|uniref:hypothetical protein n=1 Tax=Algihabitans albus TaxID=2164067 RepID=UPI001ABC5148|nr:hypothetical protein [Algihabitans albus]